MNLPHPNPPHLHEKPLWLGNLEKVTFKSNNSKLEKLVGAGGLDFG